MMTTLAIQRSEYKPNQKKGKKRGIYSFVISSKCGATVWYSTPVTSPFYLFLFLYFLVCFSLSLRAIVCEKVSIFISFSMFQWPLRSALYQQAFYSAKCIIFKILLESDCLQKPYLTLLATERADCPTAQRTVRGHPIVSPCIALALSHPACVHSASHAVKPTASRSTPAREDVATPSASRHSMAMLADVGCVTLLAGREAAQVQDNSQLLASCSLQFAHPSTLNTDESLLTLRA